MALESNHPAVAMVLNRTFEVRQKEGFEHFFNIFTDIMFNKDDKVCCVPGPFTPTATTELSPSMHSASSPPLRRHSRPAPRLLAPLTSGCQAWFILILTTLTADPPCQAEATLPPHQAPRDKVVQ